MAWKSAVDCYIKAMKNFFSIKVKGGALYVSIIISVVVAIILSLFILLSAINQRSITAHTLTTQLRFDLKSALEIARSDYFNESMNGKWMSISSANDSVRIKKLYWGAYQVLCAEARNRQNYFSESGIYGVSMTPDTALMVTENSRPVGMSGNIVFRSKVYLPKSGIRPAYIEGQNYYGHPGNSLQVRQAFQEVPVINETLISGLNRQKNEIDSDIDSVINGVPSQFNRSFTKSTLTCMFSGRNLGNSRLKNNIKIICGNVEVDPSSDLENTLIVCDKVRFKSGFKGSLHVIARDSIIVEDGCNFEFPSSFVLLPDNRDNKLSYIHFNANCRFFGAVLAITQAPNTTGSKVFVKLNAQSEVNGLIYSSNYMHIEGKLNATLICDRLLIKSPSAVYENHLLGCDINPHQYGNLLVIPSCFKEKSGLLCASQLN